MANFNCALLCGVIAVTVGLVSALTEEERMALRAAAFPYLLTCGQENGVTKEQLMAAKEAKNPDAINSCFYACFFKKAGIMNKDGLFDPKGLEEKHKKYIHSEEDMNKLKEIGVACSPVNDQTVSDGNKGCDRAKLLVHCLTQHNSQFTLEKF